MKMSKMKHMRMFQLKWLGATNTQSSRIKITDLRSYMQNTSIIIVFDHEYNNMWEQAWDELENRGITCTHYVTGSDSYDFLLTDDFETRLR